MRLALVLLLLAAPAHAIRPFITDDARVVGARLLQLETWAQADRQSFQHWVVPAFGPTDHIELTVGAVHGAHYAEGARYAIAGPLFQMKLLLHHATPNREPGVALAGGTILPFGRGGFEQGPSGFVYIAFTESLGRNERVLIHANLGLSLTSPAGARTSDLTPHAIAGVGTQIRAVAGLHAVAELVYGDAYTGIEALSLQGGFRYIFGDHVQMDGTVGAGLAGEERPVWGTLGLRIVSNRLW